MYRRVAGDLPSCRKLAINTDPAKVLKNEYLEDDDLLVEGDAATVLNAVSDRLDATTPAAAPPPWFAADVRAGSDVNPEPSSKLVYDGRRRVALAVAGLLSGWSRPVLVDDSSMFGGLLAEHYDDLPSGLRVFGGHGGFVGCGLAYAIGLALAESDSRVLCTLGDQAFTNSYQALVAAVQSKVRLLLLVCNNGGSVSLKKQATASYGAAPRRYLENASGFDYREVSRALGVPAERVAVPVGAPSATMAGAVAELSAVLDQSASVDGPALVELVLPADPEAWRGIWVTQGFELSAPVTAG
jgi:acetolactate synthase-1/2/3 large subunit